MSASMEARIAEHVAAPTPPLPVASPPLPLLSPLTTNPADAGVPLCYRADRIWMRAASPPLLLLSTSYRTDIPKPGTTLEADLRRDRVMETGYGITDTWDEIVEAMLEENEEFQTSSEDRSAAIEDHVKTLEAQVATLIAQTSSLQTQLTTTLRRIETLEARDPDPQDKPTEAGSSC
ncbi:hypothetical protein Tco_0897576 [Tanacetum coccineum]